jgi:hypothetical protein
MTEVHKSLKRRLKCIFDGRDEDEDDVFIVNLSSGTSAGVEPLMRGAKAVMDIDVRSSGEMPASLSTIGSGILGRMTIA